MTFSRTTVVTSLLALAVSLPALAQTDPPPAEEEPVRVYTNTDLERFGPPSKDSGPIAGGDDAGWDFVTEFLKREHERIDADRSYDMERRREALEEELARRDASATAVYPYYDGYGYPYHGKGRGIGHRGTHRGRTIVTPPALGGRIIPLHAGPTLAERQRAKAIRNSGVDAFPSNSRRINKNKKR